MYRAFTMAATILLALAIVTPAGYGIFVSLKNRKSETVGVRLLYCAVASSLGVALFQLIYRMSNSPLLDWNGAKLAPIVGMT